MLDFDLVQEEVEPPFNRWCCSGHVAPETFKREGPNGVAMPTRFFRVSGKGVNQIVCELCLIVANHMAKLKKQGKI